MTQLWDWHDPVLSVGCVCMCMTWLVLMCAMISSYMCHESFMCMPWLIHLCDVTHSCVWHDSFIHIPWLILVYVMTYSYVYHDSFICTPWLIYTHAGNYHRCTLTHAYVWDDAFICVTWLIHIPNCPVHLIASAVSDGCVAWLIHTCDMTLLYVWHDALISSAAHLVYSHAQFQMGVSHDSYTCVTWLIHTCDMTRSCPQLPNGYDHQHSFKETYRLMTKETFRHLTKETYLCRAVARLVWPPAQFRMGVCVWLACHLRELLVSHRYVLNLCSLFAFVFVYVYVLVFVFVFVLGECVWFWVCARVCARGVAAFVCCPNYMVRACVYLCFCVFVCILVYWCVCARARACVCVSVYTKLWSAVSPISTIKHTRTYNTLTHTHTRTNTRAHPRKHKHTRTLAHTHTHTHTRTHTPLCPYAFTYLFAYSQEVCVQGFACVPTNFQEWKAP